MGRVRTWPTSARSIRSTWSAHIPIFFLYGLESYGKIGFFDILVGGGVDLDEVPVPGIMMEAARVKLHLFHYYF